FQRALQNPIHFSNQDKFIILSDQHRGTNDWGDDFAHNQLLFFHALTSYYEDGFTYIENGDGDELSENWRFPVIRRAHSHVFRLMRMFHKEGRLKMIYGNHDAVRQYPRVVRRTLHTYFDDRYDVVKPLFDGIEVLEGVVLVHEESGKQIFVTHGHQADFFNSYLWWLGVLTLPLWKGIAQKMLGWKDPTSPAQNRWKKNRVEKNLIDWVRTNNQILIAGHTHRSWHPLPGEAPYFNAGSCIHPRAITGIEIQNGTIALVKWWLNTKRAPEDEDTAEFSRMDRALYVDRKLLMTDREETLIPPIPLEELGL
ncbi:MAG TPA: metallophosphoesterase, partial [Anaerolineales bacterium]|nr:metallophosphoesterase [Anaerolineales bacterium]